MALSRTVGGLVALIVILLVVIIIMGAVWGTLYVPKPGVKLGIAAPFNAQQKTMLQSALGNC